MFGRLQEFRLTFSAASRRPAAALAFLSCLAVLAAPARADFWQPAPETTYDWVLNNQITDIPPADVIDVDMFETTAATVAALHAAGKKTICYISFGSWENWRPDKAKFPASVIGKPLAGWAGERYLDVRQRAILGPIFNARLALCKQKGFDAVEPDNLDAYETNSGFPITRADEIRFIRWLAVLAHNHGLSIGLKNVPEFTTLLVSQFDWALTEDCFAQGWCAQSEPFITAGKAVFATEYTDNHIGFAAFCKQAKALRLSPLLKTRALTAWSKRCP